MHTQIKTWLGAVVVIIIAITIGALVWVWEKNQPEITNNFVQVKTEKTGTDQIGMANPASVFCKQNGGTLEIRTGADGGQTGYCKFSDGSECEEWKYFRGECKTGDSLSSDTDASGWQTYRNEKYGYEIKLPSHWKAYSEYNGKVIARSPDSFPQSRYIITGNPPEINFHIELMNGKATVEEYVEDFLSDAVKIDDIKISGNDGYKYIKNQNYHFLIKGNKRFVEIYSSGTNDDLNNQILSTFKFTAPE